MGNFSLPRSTVRVLTGADATSENSASGETIGMYVQNGYKPLPNLSLGLGVRFDREAADSLGYSFFEPAPERALFDRLSSLAGQDLFRANRLVDKDDLEHMGITGDPLYRTP